MQWKRSFTLGTFGFALNELGFVTIFVISGFLTSYIILKMTARRYSNFRYLPFLTLRYLRLMPQLFIYILLSFLLQPLFSGPIWRVYTEKLANNCYKNWWINALNLQNFLSMQESVMPVEL